MVFGSGQDDHIKYFYSAREAIDNNQVIEEYLNWRHSNDDSLWIFFVDNATSKCIVVQQLQQMKLK